MSFFESLAIVCHYTKNQNERAPPLPFAACDSRKFWSVRSWEVGSVRSWGVGSVRYAEVGSVRYAEVGSVRYAEGEAGLSSSYKDHLEITIFG